MSQLDRVIREHLQKLPKGLQPKLPDDERIIVIDNPKAGGGTFGSHAQYAAHLYGMLGYDIDVWETERAGHATELAVRAAQEKATLVIAASGDGGVRETVKGLMSIEDAAERPKFSVIPKGTANILAKTVGLQLGPFPDFFHACLKQIFWARTRRIDIGLLNGEAFACFVGFGFDAAVIENVEPSEKRLFKEWSFVKSALKTLFGWDSKESRFKVYEPPLLQVSGVDDKGREIEKEGYFVAVGNVQDYGTNLFPFMQGATLDDGLLDVVIVHTKDVKDLLTIGTQVVARSHYSHPKVSFFRTKHSLYVEGDDGRVPVHADSELMKPRKRNHIQVEPSSLRVVY